MERNGLWVHAAMLATVAIWGSNVVALKHLIEQVGTLNAMLIQIYLASIFFVGYVAYRRGSLPKLSRSEWYVVLVIGCFGVGTNQLFVTLGTGYLSAAVASLLLTSTPIYMALLSRIFLKESLPLQKILGIVIAFTGFLVVLMFGSAEAKFSVDNLLGVLLISLAPLSFTISTLVSRSMMQVQDAKIITAYSVLVAGILMLPLLIMNIDLVPRMMEFGRVSWLASLSSSMLAMVVAYSLWYRGLRSLHPSQIAIYVYLMPFFGVIAAWLLRGETITMFLLLGGCIILAGVIVTNRSRQAPAAKSTPRPTGTPQVAVQPVRSREEPMRGK